MATGAPRTTTPCRRRWRWYRRSISEVGFLAWELRPAALDHLGLSVALPRYVREWADHYGIEVSYSGEAFSKDGMSREAEIAFYPESPRRR